MGRSIVAYSAPFADALNVSTGLEMATNAVANATKMVQLATRSFQAVVKSSPVAPASVNCSAPKKPGLLVESTEKAGATDTQQKKRQNSSRPALRLSSLLCEDWSPAAQESKGLRSYEPNGIDPIRLPYTNMTTRRETPGFK